MLTRKLLAGHFVPTDRLFAIAMFIAAVLGTQPAFAATIAYDMVGSASQNLLSHTNPYENAFSSASDGFQKYQRGVSPTIPFSVLDDSLSIFPADSLGIIGEGNTDVFFGVTDTVNGDNSGPVSATWVFDVAGAGPLQLSIDMGAMGDFEANDVFTWTYSFDGGAAETAFASTVDEDGAHTYTLEGGASFTLSDPMLVNGTVLSNELATFTAGLNGSGSELTITLTASTDGGSEAFAFQNLVLAVGSEPPPPPELEIWEIQGDGPATPYDGQVVISRDNVVTALAADGFFMQTPPDRSDGNVDTSDGVFVYTGAAPAESLVTLEIDHGVLPPEHYRLTIRHGLTDVAGNALDGDGDATGGDDYVSDFTIVTDLSVSVGDFRAPFGQGLMLGARVSSRDRVQLGVSVLTAFALSLSQGADPVAIRMADLGARIRELDLPV